MSENIQASYLVDDNGVKLELVDAQARESIKNLSAGGAVVASDDIPKVFFSGTTPTTKAEDELPLTMEYISKTKRFFSYVTLKVQGDSSAGYALKNFNMKMFSDEARTEKLKMKFRDWTFGTHKYCLKKNWIDVLNVRNVVNGRLWGQVVRTRSDFADYPAEYRASSNCGAVDGFPVKVYVNGIYQGLYTWNIRKDESMFNMDDETGTHAALIADSANSAVLWRALPNIDGTDWTDELNDVVPEAVKNGFRAVCNFVMSSTDSDFKNNIEQYFYKSSLIDYYVFIYTILMVGGLGKSQTMFTYNATKFFANIYDMDTTWALKWDGSGFYPTTTICPDGYMQISGDGASNRLYERIVKAFPDEIRERYFELRANVLSAANIIGEMERFSDPLISAKLYEEEVSSTTPYGTGRPSKDTNTVQKLRQIIAERLAFCDEQFANLKSPVPATSVVLSAGSLTFEDQEPKTLTATVEPVDTTDTVVWTSTDNNVATVENGVVTPVSNGSCVIKATAGSISAECNVVVQYAEKYCTAIRLSASNLTFASNEPQTLVATVEPSDTTDIVVWSSSDDTIATVENGVVTPKWNGNAIITAVCGAQRSECAVTVSGIEANPLDGVVLYSGKQYSTTDGTLVDAENFYSTSKFRLSSGHKDIAMHGNQMTVLVWDKNNNYLGAMKYPQHSVDGSAVATLRIVAVDECKYAIMWRYTLAEDDISSLTISDKTSSGTAGRVELDLSTIDFEDMSISGSPCAVIKLTSLDGMPAIAHQVALQEAIATASCPMYLSAVGVQPAVHGSGVCMTYWKMQAGVYTPYLVFAGTAADVSAYFKENKTVLTFN